MSIADLGLRNNPFEELTSLWILDEEKFFVKQREDFVIDEITNEAMAAEGSGLVFLVGELGYGKTIRLSRIRKRFLRKGAFCSFVTVEPGIISSSIRKMLIDSINNRRGILMSLKRKLRFPMYTEIEKLHNGSLSPTKAADIIIDSMLTNTPSSILIDDLQNIYFSSAEWRFYLIEMLRHLVSSMPEGLLFLVSVTPQAYELLERDFSAFTSRVHAVTRISPLSNEEAIAFTQKRLSRFRLQPVGDALFPFSEEVIERANEHAKGVPSELIRILDLCIKIGVRKRVERITDEIFDLYLYLETPVQKALVNAPFTLKREFRIMLETFQDEPFTLDQVAIEMGIPLEKEFFRVEELADLNVVKRTGKNYIVNQGLLKEVRKRKIEILG